MLCHVSVHSGAFCLRHRARDPISVAFFDRVALFSDFNHLFELLDQVLLPIVGEFSSICCTSIAHAGNTKIWAKIISAYAKKCSITGFSSLRGGGGGGQKTQVYMQLGHEHIEKPSDQ